MKTKFLRKLPKSLRPSLESVLYNNPSLVVENVTSDDDHTFIVWCEHLTGLSFSKLHKYVGNIQRIWSADCTGEGYEDVIMIRIERYGFTLRIYAHYEGGE